MSEHKFPTELIDLPSKGWFYDQDNPLASGQVELKYLTAKEEDILTSTNLIAKGVVIDRLLQALIVDDAIDYSTLLTGDKNGIMIAARILGYGKDYKVKVTCQNCGKKHEVTVNLTELEERKGIEPETKGTNSFTYELPLSKKTVTFRLLTHGQEVEIKAELAALKKLGTDVDNTLSTRLKHSIIAVDGDTATGHIREFIDNEFLARDARSFREYYREINPDMDLSFEFVCENDECSERRDVMMPIGIDFFWPDTAV